MLRSRTATICIILFEIQIIYVPISNLLIIKSRIGRKGGGNLTRIFGARGKKNKIYNLLLFYSYFNCLICVPMQYENNQY